MRMTIAVMFMSSKKAKDIFGLPPRSWIESDGKQCVEIAQSTLSASENKLIVDAINNHWAFINEQISKTFRGEKTEPKNIEK